MGTDARANAKAHHLVGRTEELAAIEAGLASARAGVGSLLLIEGPAGIGKTSLLREARRTATGMTVLHGLGTEFEREYPFGVVRQALGPVVRGAESRARLLTGTARLAAPALLDDEEAQEAIDASPFGRLNGLHWLIAGLADEQPVLLLIDDAHWADEPSLRLLGFLARRIESLPVALVIGARTEADFRSAPAGLADVRDQARAHGIRLEPRPLDSARVADVLAAVAGAPVDEAMTAACLRATGGNPFLLDELVRTLSGSGVGFAEADANRVDELSVPGVTRSLNATLERLGPRATAVARAIAVLGEGSETGLVAELAELAPQDASAAAGDLAAAGILTGATTDLRFRHPILAGAVRDGLSPPDRVAAHRQAAELLRSHAAPADRVALQLLQLPPVADARVVSELRQAARQARERGAPAIAAKLLDRALAEPPFPEERFGVLLDLGRAEADVGRADAAAERLLEAHRIAADPIGRAEAAAILATALPSWDSPAMERIAAMVQSTYAEVVPLDRELGLRLRTFLVLRSDRGDDLDLAGDTPAEAACLGALVFARMDATARADEIAALAQRGARQADALLSEGGIGLSFTGIVLGLRWSDRLDEAERLLAGAIESARRRGSQSDFAIAMTLRANVHRRAGRLAEAEADARSAMPSDLDDGWLFARGVQPLACCLLDQGRVEEAAAALEVVVPAGTELPDAPPMIPVVLARMAVSAASRQPEAARSGWQDALRRVEHSRGVNAGWIDDLAVAVDVHQALGEVDAARAIARQAVELAERWGTPGAAGQALHAMVRAGAAEDPEAALREAVALLAESPARLEHARALVALGGQLRRAGHRMESRPPLREGYELAVECGASGLADHARVELRAGGVRVRREDTEGSAALTPSERRVAAMAAEGLSNAEIAQELFLTVKTVEMHLTQGYRKLGIRGRRDLPRALAGPV